MILLFFVAVISDTLCLVKCRKDGMVSFEAFERLMLRLDITMDADHAVFLLTMATGATLKLHNLQLWQVPKWPHLWSRWFRNAAGSVSSALDIVRYSASF